MMSEPASENALKRDLVIAFIEDHPKARMLLRVARNHANRIGGRWRAVIIETPGHPGPAEGEAQERLLRLLTIAKQMGAETAHREAETLEKGMMQLLEAEKPRLAGLIVGNLEATYGIRLRKSAHERVAQLARKYDVPVEIVPLSGHSYRRSLAERLRWIRPVHIFYAVLSVSVAYLGALALQWLLPPALFRVNNQNIGLLFMTACAFSASRFGLLPGLVASLASFLTINYFFTPPYHLLALGSVTDLLNMGIFLSAALLISLFTSRARGFAEKAAKRELGTQALFTLYRIAAGANSRAQALEKLQDKLTRMLDMDVAFFLPPPLNLSEIEVAFPAGLALDESAQKALSLCWSEMKTTGLASAFDPGTRWRFEPMAAPGGEIGVLGVRPRGRHQLDAWFGRLLMAIADQTASVIEHIELEYSMEMGRLSAEREKLRSTLLSSVSHDLKTPLAAISGALNLYRTHGQRLPCEKREELIDTALQETERLGSFITNILDMTRLESGKIGFKYDWHDAQSFLREVLGRLNHRLRSRTIAIHQPAAIEVYMDLMMTEQVLQNILDNACKYTPADTNIDIRLTAEDGKGFCCEVRDFGRGLPPQKLERVFDKYARLQMQDTQVAGTGLGLAICKAVMEAQGGHVTAANHPGGGAVFRLWLPRWRKAKSAKHVA